MNQRSATNSEDRLSPGVRVTLWLGSAAILVAMACDASAVVGRHVGIPLLGAIEIVQAAVSVAGASAIAAATQLNLHATIRVFTDRLARPHQSGVRRITDGLAAAFFAALALGCGWLAWDLRASSELTDLLTIPVLPFRIFVTLAFGLTALSFGWNAIRAEISQ